MVMVQPVSDGLGTKQPPLLMVNVSCAWIGFAPWVTNGYGIVMFRVLLEPGVPLTKTLS